MADCTVCKKSVTTTRQNSSIACMDCKKPCHGTCVNMTKDDIECLLSQGQPWRCPPCSKVRRSSMVLNTPDKSKTETSRIIEMLKEAKEERTKMDSEMNKSFEFVHKLIEDQKNVLKEQNKQLADFMNLVQGLQDENQQLRKRVKELETRIDDTEQYQRANTVEIYGIPELPDEDTYEVVSKVGAALDMDISRDMVDICHRLGKSKDPGRPSGIIVKFVRREVKQILLKKRRKRNRDFTTQHVGYQISSGPIPVFINESLTLTKIGLYKAAKEAKKSKGYKYLWVQNGRVLMRQADDTSVIHIATKEDIASL